MTSISHQSSFEIDGIKYRIASLQLFDPEKVKQYFEALIHADLLKYRLCADKNPGPTEIVKYISEMGPRMYVIFTEHDKRILAETTLDTPSGQVWQVHFSMHPDPPVKTKIRIARKVITAITSWPEVSALFGLTPIKNRQACWFVLRTGFKKLAVLPNGTFFNGDIADAMLSVYGVD